MKILVLGGTRFIGAHAVRRLVARGFDVTVFHRGTSETELPAGVRHLHGDRARRGDHDAEFRRLAPDVVVALFAMTERDARLVVDVFAGVARRLVVVSSADVYRAYGRLVGTEPGPPDPMPL